MIKPAPRVVIAGTGSGCGKTTTVCAILQALKNRGLSPMSFKCGPDYIDPMFHSGIIGVDSANLDIFFAGEAGVRSAFVRHAADVNVVEGVMGMYDGLAMDSDVSSSYHLARVLDAPVVLVLNVRGMALSAAAAVKGYMTLRSPNVVRGVIFNKVSPMTYPSLSKVVEKECGIPVLGYLPDLPECSLESRHLGLVTAAEVSELQSKMQRLAEAAEKTLDLDGLLELMRAQQPLSADVPSVEKLGSVRLAVARDKAFCFYYRDNLELFEALGAEIVPFSPVSDERLPDCDGLYMGGGYPELYLDRLGANETMKASVRQAVESGLPTVAECGAFMYLCRNIDGVPMTDVIHTDCRGTGKLTRFGYATLHAESESLLFSPGDTLQGHEFHYWDAEAPGTALRAVKPNGRETRCAYVSETLYAGYPHLYFPSRPEAAARFIQKCIDRRNLP